MGLDANEVGYFIQQVGLSAQSFGVATADITAVGKLLSSVFDVKCGAPAVVIPAQGAQLQSICTADDCPTAANASCSSYATFPGEPKTATTTQMSPTSTGSSGSSGSGSSGGSSGGAQSNMVFSFAAGGVMVLVGGLAVLL